MAQRVIYWLFFCSGMAGLIYQLIWVRKLVLIFGNTTYATSGILTAFMAGLALGSYLFGRYADRIKAPLKLYGYLELGISFAGMLILFFFLPISDALYKWLFGLIGNRPNLFNLVRLLLSLIVLIIPTTLMGGTLPAISKFMIRQSSHFGQRLGVLYGLNTLGAVLGAFFTGYFFIYLFGLSVTLWIAIVLNFIVGITAVLLAQRFALRSIGKEGRSKPAKPTALSPGVIRSYSPRTAQWVLYLFGLSGFVSLAYEVVWTRALIFFVSSTTYSFTIILTTFLVGIAVGSLIVSRYVDRLNRLMVWFSILEMIIAVVALATIPLLLHLNAIQLWFAKVLSSTSWTSVSFQLFFTAFAILIIPTLCMGAAFPVVNRIYVESTATVGQGVGTAYMANTIGAILGSFAAGFVLIPLMGMNTSILILACINLSIAITVLFLEKDFSIKALKHYGLAALGMIIFVALVLSTFTTKPLFLKTAGFFDTRLLHYQDTAAGTVSVLEKKDQINIWGRNVRYLNINGHNTAHTTFSDMIIHKMLAHLPTLLTPNPKHVLVVGFGFGNTCRSFLDYDLVKTVDCVELVAHEKKTADYFRTENAGVFDDPRFTYIVNDGRNYILAARKQYDIISINSVDPKFSPTLYTEDFYRLCRARLNEDGQLVAWLPIYGMNLDEVQALVKSFIKVFPNASLWYNNPEHLLLIGIKGYYPIDLALLKERMESPRVAASLADIHLNDPMALLATFYCGSKMLDQFAADAVSHSDDHPIVEFSRVPTKDMVPEVYQELLKYRESVLQYCIHPEALGEAEAIRNQIFRHETEMKNLMAALFTYRMYGNVPQQKDLVAEAIRSIRSILDTEPRNDFALMQYVDLVSHQDLATDRKYFEQAVRIAPHFSKAYVLLGLEQANRKQWEQARDLFLRAIEISKQYPTAYLNLGHTEIQLQHWERAKQAFEQLILLDPENPFVYSTIAQVYYMLEDYPAAIRAMQRAIKDQPAQANLYFNLGRMYQKNDQIKEAISAFEQGLKISPYDQRARLMLEELKKYQ